MASLIHGMEVGKGTESCSMPYPSWNISYGRRWRVAIRKKLLAKKENVVNVGDEDSDFCH